MKREREPAGLAYDHFKVDQLIICLHGPVTKSGPQFSPYGIIPATSVRNHQLVGSIYKIVGISGPFLALEPQGINYRGHNVIADIRSGVKFQEVDQAFLDALTAKPKAEQRQSRPGVNVVGLPSEMLLKDLQLSFLSEENYGVTPPSNSSCGNPECTDCNPDDEDEDDEPDCSITD